MNSTLFCKVDGCTRPKYAKSLCTMHYGRQYTKGQVGPASSTRKPRGTYNNVAPNGYRQVHIAGQPRYEHICVMEQHLGRKLLPKEVVHHEDHNRSNNAIGNLKVFASQKEHMQYHRQERLLQLGLPAHFRYCAICKTWDDPTKLIPHGKNGISYKHKACWNMYMRNYKQRNPNA